MAGEGETEATTTTTTTTTAEDSVVESKKSDALEEDAAVVEAVAERLGFFFSNANLRSDRFLRSQTEEADLIGKKPLPVDILLKFNSIKQHTTQPATIIKAAKTLGSDFLLVDEEHQTIARQTPMTKEQLNDNIPLTVVVENLKMVNQEESNSESNNNSKKYVNTVAEIRALFDPEYGKVVLVKFRYGKSHNGKSFPRGNCFVEFETQEQQEKAVKALVASEQSGNEADKDKIKTLELSGNTLEIIPMSTWMEHVKEQKSKRNGDNNSKKRKKNDGGDDDNHNDDNDEGEEEQQEAAVQFKKFTLDWKKGCVIQLQGLGATCDRESILEAVKKGMGTEDQQLDDRGMVKGVYADFSRGQTEGAIRFPEPSEGIAQLASRLNSGDVKIANQTIGKAVVLEGQEETDYWNKFIEFKNRQAKNRAEEKAAAAAAKRKKRRRG